MKYSISQSARIVGVTRKTLYKHIESKPISVEKDDNDRPVIDASELIRIYGDQCHFDFQDDNQETGDRKQPSTEVSIPEATEVAVTKKELELIKERLAAEKENFEEQIDYLRKKLDEANSESRKLTALLTDQSSSSSKASAWENSIKALENRIANQERAAKEREDREQKILRQNQSLRKALEQEKSKPLWKKLFG